MNLKKIKEKLMKRLFTFEHSILHNLKNFVMCAICSLVMILAMLSFSDIATTNYERIMIVFGIIILLNISLKRLKQVEGIFSLANCMILLTLFLPIGWATNIIIISITIGLGSGTYFMIKKLNLGDKKQ